MSPEPFAVWDQEDLALFVPPSPDRETGQWVTVKQLRDLFDAHGRSYVEHVQPEWVNAAYEPAFNSLESRLAEMKAALNDNDLPWALGCWESAVRALAKVHPDAAQLLPNAHRCAEPNEHGFIVGNG